MNFPTVPSPRPIPPTRLFTFFVVESRSLPIRVRLPLPPRTFFGVEPHCPAATPPATTPRNLPYVTAGAPRNASDTLADQVARSEGGDTAMIDNLHRTQDLGLQSRDLRVSGDLDGYAELMHEHWETKRDRSPATIIVTRSISSSPGSIRTHSVSTGAGGASS